MKTSTRTAIVTGGASGIGKAIVERLARDGIAVAVADKDEKQAAEVASNIQNGRQIISVGVDVSDRNSVENMIESSHERLGALDILICNAGIMDRVPFMEMEENFWDNVLNTNLGGVFRCSQVAARYMISGSRGGRIVNVASNSGIFGGRGRAAYGASKAGIINLTQTMAIELAEHNILVNAVAPGPTKTRADQPDAPWPSVAMRMPLNRYGRPEEIAEVAAFLASPACSFTTGHVVSADGGFTIAGIMEG